eukprot:759071-Hanusia_phi.AAC.9
MGVKINLACHVLLQLQKSCFSAHQKQCQQGCSSKANQQHCLSHLQAHLSFCHDDFTPGGTHSNMKQVLTIDHCTEACDMLGTVGLHINSSANDAGT